MGKQGAKDEKTLSFEKLRKITDNPSATVHFVGVGGVSMYSLARLAMLGRARVTGSDRERSERTDELSALGADICIGHCPDNVKGASVVVYTHAISLDNPELVRARELSIPVVSRAEYMGALMMGYRNRIGISGSHGKSSTVAMLDTILTAAGYNPTVLSGAELPVGEPLKVGAEDLMIYEACEYKDSFLRFAPTISVGLNLELDHTDYFKDINVMKTSFAKALGKATDVAVVNGDDENLSAILKNIKTKVITFGQWESNTYRYFINAFRECGFDFTLYKSGECIGEFSINVPGAFNVSNATAAIVVALEYGVSYEVIRDALLTYRGIHRRLEYVGERRGRAVYYDYAHHPTEIAASINALKMLTHDLVTVVFKPHTYTRTESLWEDFRMSLSLADHVIMTDIFAAREEEIVGVDSKKMASQIGVKATYRDDGDILPYLDMHTHGVIVVMGAGDTEHIKNDVLFKYI